MLWEIIYADGTKITSEQYRWSQISERVIHEGTSFDILTEPAIEIRMRLSLGQPWHRLRAREPVQFFHHLRMRVPVTGLSEPKEMLYESAGFLFPGGRVVLDVAPEMGITRVEFGEFSFEPLPL
jgi:hypothetical protein